MISISNAVFLKDLSLGMAFELLIVIALIVLFIVSLCGLLQKIKQAYQQETITGNEPNRVTISQVYVQDYPPNYSDVQGEVNQSIYPGNVSPPPYIELMDPPPKYDDVIKTSNIQHGNNQSHTLTSVVSQ